MTAVALAAFLPPNVAAAPRAVFWTALALALAALALPACCLNGSHAAGSGMKTFAPVCHAAR
jgi:hypothetical protein